MDGFFLDIIFLAAIVVFFFFKLRSVLGKRTGNERKWDFDPLNKNNRQQSDLPNPHKDVSSEKGSLDTTVQTRSQREVIDLNAWEEIADSSSLDALKKIHGKDKSFDAVQFLDGAKIAFERIISAFAADRKDALKELLNKEVYGVFAAVIDRRQSLGHRLYSTLVSLDDVRIVDADLEGSKAYVTVEFTSRQISVTKDRDSHIVEGDPKQIGVITDTWTFSRDLKSRNPNWLLVATGA